MSYHAASNCGGLLGENIKRPWATSCLQLVVWGVCIRISEEIKDEIIEAAKNRLPELISDFVPTLIKRAGGVYSGLCPFHVEKTASFTVNPKGFYHCFGCGEKGDSIKFIRQITGKSFPESLEFLADKLGITIPRVGAEFRSEEEERRSAEKKVYLAVMDQAANAYQDMLISPTNGDAAREYLFSRNMSADIIQLYKIGFAPDSWQYITNLYNSETLPIAEKLGLVRKGKGGRYYDSLRSRIVFPISYGNHFIAFAGRSLDDSLPKYLNSPETPLYIKSETLFGLDLARDAIQQKKDVLVVEGYVDHMNLWRLGFKNVVATCGTAMTPSQVKAMISSGARKIELMFDGDSPGVAAIKKAVSIVEQCGVEAKVRLLPDGCDPGDMISAEEMPVAISSAEFLFRQTEDGERKLRRLDWLDSVFDKSVEDPVKALALRMLFGDGGGTLG